MLRKNIIYRLPPGTTIQRRRAITYRWWDFITTKNAYYTSGDVTSYIRDCVILKIPKTDTYDKIMVKEQCLISFTIDMIYGTP